MQFLVGKCEVMRPGTKSSQSAVRVRVVWNVDLSLWQVLHLSLVSHIQGSSHAALAKHKNLPEAELYLVVCT